MVQLRPKVQASWGKEFFTSLLGTTPGVHFFYIMTCLFQYNLASVHDIYTSRQSGNTLGIVVVLRVIEVMTMNTYGVDDGLDVRTCLLWTSTRPWVVL